jgi:SNF2-related domain
LFLKHFLKNLKTYWAMAAGLMCLHSERVGILTGTPFNNSCQDMAALMTFIDPSHNSAVLGWWRVKMGARSGKVVMRSLADWTDRYVLRREKDVIAHLLKKKNIVKEKIESSHLGT